MMMNTMARRDFETLNDVSLIWFCIEPVIQQIRGKNLIVKSEVYSHLNCGQRALLMFQVLYGHTSHGVEEFFVHLSYLLADRGVWSQLKKGMRYFEEDELAAILEKMEALFQNIENETVAKEAEYHDLTGTSSKDELSASINQINQTLMDVLPLSCKRIAAYIRKNGDEFVQFID